MIALPSSPKLVVAAEEIEGDAYRGTCAQAASTCSCTGRGIDRHVPGDALGIVIDPGSHVLRCRRRIGHRCFLFPCSSRCSLLDYSMA